MSESDVLRQRVEQAVGALFTIEDEIGRGGMAVVYRARDVRLRRRVALKVLPPELAFRDDVKRRFLREAQMAAQLSHPNIVPIYAVDDHEGVVYFAMGLVEGETLAQQLHREPRPDVATVRRVLREVADALAYAHARQVVHRDVKPDNILIDRESGRAVVTDFGIARAAEGDQKLTVTGIAVGTPAYMSPEQAMGEREVDGRSDIYALGVVGWQMLAGELPFQANNTPSMLMKHISERPRPLATLRPDLPANLVYAIERAMSKGRGERWPDALAFRDALAADAPDGPVSRAHPPTAGVVDADRRGIASGLLDDVRRDPIGEAAAFGADAGLHAADHLLSKPSSRARPTCRRIGCSAPTRASTDARRCANGASSSAPGASASRKTGARSATRRTSSRATSSSACRSAGAAGGASRGSRRSSRFRPRIASAACNAASSAPSPRSASSPSSTR
ncbi:MAG: serine/threonine protein kinase [Gemmatimonadetes bacterium]|nr:serine/threonine protein kinase [Gemmatimonadota bacterium]